jgi:hypothetical protein
MSGQLCWLPKLAAFGANGPLILHLRLDRSQPWKPHTAYPGLCVPDYLISRGSKGWATSQKLLQTGWTIIPTHEARRSFAPSSKAA